MSCGGGGSGAGAETSIGALVVGSVAAGWGVDPFALVHSGRFVLGTLPASPHRGTGGITIKLLLIVQ